MFLFQIKFRRYYLTLTDAAATAFTVTVTIGAGRAELVRNRNTGGERSENSSTVGALVCSGLLSAMLLTQPRLFIPWPTHLKAFPGRKIAWRTTGSALRACIAVVFFVNGKPLTSIGAVAGAGTEAGAGAGAGADIVVVIVVVVVVRWSEVVEVRRWKWDLRGKVSLLQLLCLHLELYSYGY